MSDQKIPSSQFDFTLDDFESAAEAAHFEKCEHYFSCILDHLRQGYPLQGGTKVNTKADTTEVLEKIGGLAPFRGGMSAEETSNAYSRLAVAITVMFSSRSYCVSPLMLKQILGWKNYIREIFACSHFPNMDHILVNLGLLAPDKGLQLSPRREDFVRFLMCYSLDSGVDVDFTLFFRFDSNLATRAYLGLLNDSQRVLDSRSETIRNYLLSIHEVLEHAVVDDDLIQNASSAWMLCTYADTPYRHEFKRSMNKMLERWLLAKLPVGFYKRAERICQEGGRNVDGRPVMVVCGEVLRNSHAMFRNFAPTFRALREQYYLVLVADTSAFDDATTESFDEVCPVSIEVQDIRHTVQIILKQRPAAVYFPSIGMASWTVAACNFRFARLQVMSAGHPASSMSSRIDFFLTQKRETIADLDTSLFTERVLQAVPKFRPNLLGQLLAKHPESGKETLERTHSDGVIRLAINSSLMKISPRFVRACQLIASQSSVPLEFHFFIAERGIRADSANYTLARMLPNVHVYTLLPYGKYMQILARCDLALGTFPFGGATTNTDLLSLGIPKVNMVEGMDLSGHTDFMFWRNVGIDFLFFAENELNYVASAIYAIHNNEFLREQSEMLWSLAHTGKQLRRKRLDPDIEAESQTSFERRFALACREYDKLLEQSRNVPAEGQLLGDDTFADGSLRTRWGFMQDEMDKVWQRKTDTVTG